MLRLGSDNLEIYVLAATSGIYRLDITTGELINLTNSPAQNTELARLC